MTNKRNLFFRSGKLFSLQAIFSFSLLVVIINFLLFTPAYAYLDGGTGSVLLQGLCASIAAGLAFLRIYWEKVKKLFTRKSIQSDDKQANSKTKSDG